MKTILDILFFIVILLVSKVNYSDDTEDPSKFGSVYDTTLC